MERNSGVSIQNSEYLISNYSGFLPSHETSISMNDSSIKQAAEHFGIGEPIITVLGDGLIHKTYKVAYSGSPTIVLQGINTNNFPEPENIIHNYRVLSQQNKGIAPLIKSKDGNWFWVDGDNNFWRATKFVEGSYTELYPKTAEQAYTTAHCYGQFTRSLADVDTKQLKVIIQGFHDLAYRYNQFEQAITKATIQRLLKSTHVIAELRQRKRLVDFFTEIKSDPAAYRTRVMHHDCKMSNILLDETSRKAICPIDLDTVMPGLYFSDIGDMIRSMAVTVDENSTQWEGIDVRKEFYEAIVKGYLDSMGDIFSSEEKEHIHHAGLLLTFMQSLRFVTDFLNGDTYYQTSYPEQNLNRALNQLILLEKLEEFLERNYNYKV